MKYYLVSYLAALHNGFPHGNLWVSVEEGTELSLPYVKAHIMAAVQGCTGATIISFQEISKTQYDDLVANSPGTRL